MLDLIRDDAGPVTLPIAQIRRDGGTQPRQGMDEDAVNDYANALRSGERLPAVDVMFDGSVYWLFDGFHRTEAHLRAGLDAIPVTIHQGTLEDAQWRSFGANKGHGLRRSNADKERAVRAALRHPTGAGLSNVQVAKHVGVDDKTVARYRAEMETASEIPRVTHRSGADGKSYNTGQIAAARKSPPTPTYTPVYRLETYVRSWLANYADTPGHGRSQIELLRATRHADTPGRVALERVLEEAEIAWRKNDLTQAIDNVRSQMEVQERLATMERAEPAAFAPPPAAPPVPTVPVAPPSPPSLPADLTAAGWELRQLASGAWYCHNRSASKATATRLEAEQAVGEAYAMQQELLRAVEAVDDGASEAKRAMALVALYRQVLESLPEYRQLIGADKYSKSVENGIGVMINTLIIEKYGKR